MSTTEVDVPPCPFCEAGWPVTFCLNEKENGCFEDSSNNVEESRILNSGLPTDNGTNDTKVYKDARSTGRKRAAQLYPIKPGQVCEWAWHKNCGGGIVPIVGCTGRPASHIHHGPDKSTFNNDRSNISLVCEYCHNRWHVANDPFYKGTRPDNGETWLPQATGKEVIPLNAIQKATKEEILAYELSIPEGGKDKK